MDTRLLEDVLILLEEGSLSRAAARRHVTQPAFSRRIRAFEDWVGIDLLKRQANRIALDPRIAENEAEIRDVIGRLQEMRRRLRDGSPKARRVVFATQHAMAASIMAEAMRALRGIDPGLVVRLRTMNREDCLSYFVRGEADFLMIYEARDFPPLPFDDTIRRRTWMRDTLIPVCGGPLRETLGASKASPGPFPLIGYPPDSHFGQLIDRSGFQDAMLADGARIGVETAFSVGALNLALSGLGVAWVPHAMCRAGLSSGTLVSLAQVYGRIPLDVSLFFAASNVPANELMAGLP